MEVIFLRIIFLIILILTILRRKGNRWIHREWVIRPMNQFRNYFGFFNTQWQELKEDPEMFHRYTAMDLESFNILLGLVSGHLQKNHPAALCAEERLIIGLRYLVSGDSIFTIALHHRIGESTARGIIKEVCGVLVQVLEPDYLKPLNEEEWKHVAITFLEKWNLPNCVGAFDGKHFNVRAPPHSGSLYFNHKGTFSIILLATCDANYIFTLVHVGEMGSNSDAGIFNKTFGALIQNEELDLPKGVATLPGSNIATPCYFVGDDAFPLSTRMMKPYSGHFLQDEFKIFNYRLSRARRVIENAFGILVARFRVFESPIRLLPESVDSIILAAVCLHNFLRIREMTQNPPERLYDVSVFEENLHENENFIVLDTDGGAMRDGLKDYLLTPEGAVPWQNDSITYNPEQWAEFDQIH